MANVWWHLFPPTGLWLSGYELGRNAPDNENALTYLDFGVRANFSTFCKTFFQHASVLRHKPNLLSLVSNLMMKSHRSFSLGMETFNFIMKSKYKLGYYNICLLCQLCCTVSVQIQGYFNIAFMLSSIVKWTCFPRSRENYDDPKGNQKIGSGKFAYFRESYDVCVYLFLYLHLHPHVRLDLCALTHSSGPDRSE